MSAESPVRTILVPLQATHFIEFSLVKLANIGLGIKPLRFDLKWSHQVRNNQVSAFAMTDHNNLSIRELRGQELFGHLD